MRGLAREARHWNEFPDKLINALAQQGDVARVDAIDLPGTGRFSEMKSPLTVREMTEFAREKFNEIRKAMRARGETPPERTRILAVSLGGMVASDWIDRWPQDFQEGIFINTSFSGFSPLHHRLRPTAVAHLLGHLRPLKNPEREEFSLKLISNLLDSKSAQAIAKTWSTYADERPVTLENFGRQLLAAARFKAPSETPAVPILVLYSRNDRMVDARCSEAIVKRWKTACEIHSNAGHDLTLDDPDWVIEKTLAWQTSLKEIPAATESLETAGAK